MNHLMETVLRTGIISPNMLAEMKRISPVIDREVTVPDEPIPFELAASMISEALQAEEYVEVRETDLEIFAQYNKTETDGLLRVGNEDIKVKYGSTCAGEFIISWSGESVHELMTDPETHLVRFNGVIVHFRDVRELYFGKQKVFMVCTPVSRGDQ
jgi:hypothetical protein